MEDIIKSLYYYGGLITGRPIVLSPVVSNLEALEYIQEPLKTAPNKFRILLNVSLVKQEELTITVPKQGVVKIVIEHGRRQNAAGLWVRQNCTYTFDLPAEVRKKDLHVEWSDDNYLLIQPVSSEPASKSYPREITLVPQQVHRLLKPTLEICILQDMLEKIKERVLLVLRYIQYQSNKIPDENREETPVNKENLLAEGTGILDEAHYRLACDERSEQVSKSGESVENKPTENVAESSMEGEISITDIAEESLTSLQKEIKRLVEISVKARLPESVDEEVKSLIESLDDENSQASVCITYAKIILLLMMDRLSLDEIACVCVEPVKDTDENTYKSAASGSEPASGLADENKQLAPGQATDLAATPVKASDSADKRTHTLPPPVPEKEADEEFEECPSPEKKRKL